jgi:HK97 family phage portal protein
MLVKTLISALDRAQSQTAVKAATWALERATGVRTSDLIERKQDSDFYARNGFNTLAALQGGVSSYAGKQVTVDNALELAAMYAGVKILAEDMGGLPFFLYERSEDGETLDKAYGNNLHRVLHDAANPDMSAGEFREALTSRAVLGIDGFAEIVRNPKGEVLALWPLDGTVTQDFGTKRLRYVHQAGTAAQKIYEREEIFHLKGYTITGQRGDDVLKRAKHALGLGLAADEYAGRFFANDANPGVILERPAEAPKLSPDAVKLVKIAWKEWHQGSARSHEPSVLQDGTKAYRLDPDHQKLQLIESRKYTITEIARILRIPLHKLAELDRSTNNNIEHQGIEYVSHGLGPWRRRWEEAVHRCLLTPDEKYHPNGRPRMYAEFNVEAMLRGDFAAQTEGWSKLLEKGVYSINDVRRFLNFNPIAGGDKHNVQLNMQDVASTAATALTEQPSN